MKKHESLLLFGLILFPAILPADQVELTNGDTISGKVVSLNATHLKLESQLLGEVTLARENVAAVYLGDKRPKPAAAPAEKAAAAESPGSAEDLIQKLLGGKTSDGKRPGGKAPPAADTPQGLLDQLKGGGLDAGSIAEVQKMFPLLATKEAGGYFNDTLGGLLSGKLGIKDIRKDAMKAREGILELKKELGPDAAALDSYLGILEKFIQETGDEEEAPPAKPK
jgi:hypothetical protein